MIKRLIPALFFLMFAASTAFATSGACSSHDGVNCAAGPDSDGSVICNDTTTASSVMYRDMRNDCGVDFVPFSDLSKEHENYEAIVSLYTINVINGYPDGTFKSENKVNRAEFLKILIEGNKIELDSAQYHSCFPDISDQWYAKYVCYAKEMNWIEGYPDGDFKPLNQIYHTEAVKMLVEIHDYAQYLEPSEDPDAFWYAPYLEVAVKRDFIVNDEYLNKPTSYQTRADIAEMTFRSIVYKQFEEMNELLVIAGDSIEVVSAIGEPSEPSFAESNIYLGNLDAPVTIYEYSDFECPFCARLHAETFAQLKADYIDTGDVLYIAKDFPLSFHTNAYEAAYAARCANDQDAFWEMRDSLYENQSDWSNLSDPTEIFTGYAAGFGLETNEFEVCMADEIYMSKIAADFAEGQELGVQGTPTLIINGEFFVGSRPYADIKNFIDSILYN